MFQIVIYKIQNRITKRIYIGQTNDFNRRINNHKRELKENRHSNPYLQKDYNKYGLINFNFKILESCNSREKALKREDYWINYYGGIESTKTYNCKDNIHNNKLMKQKVSLKTKGKLNPRYKVLVSNSTRMNISNSLKGRKLTEEHKQHIKESCKKFMQENNPAKRSEVRKKISEKVRAYIKINGSPMQGKHHSVETKNKISLASKGRRKYSNNFIEELRKLYIVKNNYAEIARLNDMNEQTVRNLIKFGTPAYPKNYK